jgi:hypothetical protein
MPWWWKRALFGERTFLFRPVDGMPFGFNIRYCSPRQTKKRR